MAEKISEASNILNGAAITSGVQAHKRREDFSKQLGLHLGPLSLQLMTNQKLISSYND